MKLIKYEPLTRPMYISDLTENSYFKFKSLPNRIFVFNKKRQPQHIPDSFIWDEKVSNIQPYIDDSFLENGEIEQVILTKINFKYKVDNVKLSRFGKIDWLSDCKQTIKSIQNNRFFIWNHTGSICYKLNHFMFYVLYPNFCSVLEVVRYNDVVVSEVEIESIEYDNTNLQ